MAAIDKYYTDSWENYQELKNWAKGKTYTTPRGCKINVSSYIYAWDDKNYFEENGRPCERPIFNSPTHLDNYLYHNCPLKFIQDWLKDIYSGEGYCKGIPDEIKNNLKIPDYTPCTKVKILKKGLGECPDCFWFVSVKLNNECCWYNEDYDFFLLPNEIDEFNSSEAIHKVNIRTIIRKIIKKWKLPVGCTITIFGRYIGDTWVLKTK